MVLVFPGVHGHALNKGECSADKKREVLFAWWFCLSTEMMTVKKRYLSCFVLLMLTVSVEASTRLLPLSYLTNEEAVTLVRPLLGELESVSVHGGQLILSSSRSTYDRVKSMLKRSDIAPVSLSVSIREGGKFRVMERSSSRLSVKPSGAMQLSMLSGEPRFVKIGQGITELGIEPGRGGYHGRSGVTAQLGVRGFFLSARKVDSKIILRASSVLVLKGLHDSVDASAVSLPIYAEGEEGQWIPLPVETGEFDARRYFQVRVDEF